MRAVAPYTHSHEELDDCLSDALERIRSVYEPERVILYGSAAAGGRWHDLDLLVIAATQDRFYERLRKVALSLNSWTPTDIIVLTPDEFGTQVAEDRYFLIEEILKKGKTVYERRRRSKVADERQK